METVATLRRISADELSALLLSKPSPPVAIVDVRDHDHIGGHILTSRHVPSTTLSYTLPTLVRNLESHDTVVFHCALSQQRGPSAALAYLRERRRMRGEVEGQAVYVLQGGFEEWQRKYGSDERLTEGWVRDIWVDDD